MKRPLLPKGVLELDPDRRQVPPVGNDGFATGSLLTSLRVRQPRPDANDEDRLRALVRGCPLEREVLAALFYVRAVHPEALQRVPPPLVGWGATATAPQQPLLSQQLLPAT